MFKSQLTKNNWRVTVRNMTSDYVTLTSVAIFVNNTLKCVYIRHAFESLSLFGVKAQT